MAMCARSPGVAMLRSVYCLGKGAMMGGRSTFLLWTYLLWTYLGFTEDDGLFFSLGAVVFGLSRIIGVVEEEV